MEARSILEHYGIGAVHYLRPYGSGLIHRSWKAETDSGDYLLQQVNQQVFHRPEDIAHNIRVVGDYLADTAPDYRFIRPLCSQAGTDLVLENGHYFRLFPFVRGSHSVDVVTTKEQAGEAARQFGRFTRLLAAFDPGQLRITIPRFHDLAYRYQQFEEALSKGNGQRIAASSGLVRQAEACHWIVEQYQLMRQNPAVRLRVQHHDTKISNLLFDEAGRGLCVVDLDTLMPGYFISDLGDMMRTYLPTKGEEERDADSIVVRPEIYQAVCAGYASEMQEVLSAEELQLVPFAGTFLIYMQALRFLTDHLSDDVYYGASYPGQNEVRARNQFVLLERYLATVAAGSSL